MTLEEKVEEALSPSPQELEDQRLDHFSACPMCRSRDFRGLLQLCPIWYDLYNRYKHTVKAPSNQ